MILLISSLGTTNLSHKKIGIPRDNARLLYLAYHEGQGGYKRVAIGINLG